MQSGNQVQIRAVSLRSKFELYYWETSALWYDPSRYDATFVLTGDHGLYPPAHFEHYLGKPAATYRVENWVVLVYRTNLLRQLAPVPGPS
jgi:hypothetical protein